MSHETNTAATRSCVQSFYDAATRADTATLFAKLDEDLIVNEPSFLPYGGPLHGREQFKQLFATVARYISLDSVRLDSLAVDGDVAVAFLSARTMQTGQPLSIAERSVVHEGRIVEMTIYYHEGGDLFPRAQRNE